MHSNPLHRLAYLGTCTLVAALFFCPPPRVWASEAPRPVACLARLTPGTEVVSLSIPASSYPGLSPIAQLFVEEGDFVTNGQIVAVLENKLRLDTQHTAALARAAVAKARLQQVRTGAKASEIEAQTAEIDRLQAEQALAQLAYNRRQQLKNQQAISTAEFDEADTQLRVCQKRLESARQRLRSLREAGPADLALAEAEWKASLAEAEQKKAEAEQAVLRSPISGTVLKIHTHPGEREGSYGVIDVGDTRTMYATAEVHETDIGRVKKGQSAEISVAALPQKLKGVVERIGLQVSRNSLFSNDPAADTDARVIQVKIRLENATAAAGLVHARAQVIIHP